MAGKMSDQILLTILQNTQRLHTLISTNAAGGVPAAMPVDLTGAPLMPAPVPAPPLMPYTGGAALMPYIGGPPAALPLVPAAYQAPPQGIPHADRVATLGDLEKICADQNAVNARFLYTAQGLGSNQQAMVRALGIKSTGFGFKTPKDSKMFQVPGFKTKAAIANAPAYVPTTLVGQQAYTKAMNDHQGQDLAESIAEAMAEEADEEELAAGGAANLVIVVKTVDERKALWKYVNDKRLLAMNCPDLQVNIRANIPADQSLKIKLTGTGKLNAAGIKAIQKTREFWGFVELSDDPFDYAGGKAAFEAMMAEHGFPSDEGWNGVVDWTLHRDK